MNKSKTRLRLAAVALTLLAAAPAALAHVSGYAFVPSTSNDAPFLVHQGARIVNQDTVSGHWAVADLGATPNLAAGTHFVHVFGSNTTGLALTCWLEARDMNIGTYVFGSDASAVNGNYNILPGVTIPHAGNWAFGVTCLLPQQVTSGSASVTGAFF
jgi:hypothetical protein